MRCRRARQLLPLLEVTGGAAASRARANLLRHLEACSACRSHRNAMERVRELVLDGSPAPLADADLERLSERVALRVTGRATEGSTGSRVALRNWWRAVEARPLPTLLHAAVVVWVALILLLQIPGAEPGLRQLLDL